MGYVLKVSKAGYDVSDKNIKPKGDGGKKRETIHMLHFLAYPYLLGAKLQLMRYREEARKLNKHNSGIAIMNCLHEASCLFEDIVTILMYLEKCGVSHRKNSLLRNIRNHIRHDIRDNFDMEKHSLKKQRLKSLGIRNGLQTEIEFSFEFIRVGEKTIYLKEIDNYLAWAGKQIESILAEAKKKGLLKDE